jgi:hypothetical protein
MVGGRAQILGLGIWVLLTGCDSGSDSAAGFDAGASDSDGGTDVGGGVADAVAPDAAPDAASARPDAAGAGREDAGASPASVRLITFNIGTTDGLPHDAGDDGYTGEMAEITDAHYRNSLSWNPAEAALVAFLSDRAPDIVAFQEGFHDPWCEDIEVDPDLDFVCRDYDPDGPMQPERVLGPDFQIGCAPGQEDNCIGVRRAVGQLVGCPEDGPCRLTLDGLETPGQCGSGARVSSGRVLRPDGAEWVVVNVHGTSGIEPDDQACRVAQFRQIFVDRGDGRPEANGAVNIVMGDLNTDPVVMAGLDPSADAWNTYVGPDRAFRHLSPTERFGPATYANALRIDHIASDMLTGDCVIPGSTEGEPPVMDAVYWDHRPVVCDAR